MANYQLTTDYTNTIRDVSGLFQQVVTKIPGLLPLIGVEGNCYATKHEYLEQQTTPTSYAITAFDTDGDGTGIQFASTTGMRAGDVLSFEKATGANVTESVLIDSVDSSTEITVTRDYGSSTGVTLVVGDLAYISSPRAEATTADPDAGSEGTMNYNYTQIYDTTAKVSKTAQSISLYDTTVQGRNNNLLQMQIQERMIHLGYQKARNIIKGRRVARSATVKGTHGGLEQFVTNTNSTGGALSYTLFNAGFQALYEAGGYATNLACVGNIEQVRRISAFNTSGTNPVVHIGEQDTTGNVITRVIADFKIGQNNVMANVVLEPNMPKDELYLLDLDQIKWRPLVDRQMKSIPANNSEADDYLATRIIEETTLEIRNGAYSHLRFTGLTI